jgi:hypothetical protein
MQEKVPRSVQPLVVQAVQCPDWEQDAEQDLDIDINNWQSRNSQLMLNLLTVNDLVKSNLRLLTQ